MKWRITAALFVCMFCSCFNVLHAQDRSSIENGYAAEFYAGSRIENVTPANVLKWVTELNTELGKISARLKRINPPSEKGKATKKLIMDAKAQCLRIIKTGQALSIADARKHDRWFWDGMAQLVRDCPDTNPGSECCFSCNGGGQGYQHFWCKANCFLSGFTTGN
jgi:hypothetical protein